MTVSQLQSMSFAELESYIKAMEPISISEKRAAWDKMDTGIYDNNGDLIGDLMESEDAYQ